MKLQLRWSAAADNQQPLTEFMEQEWKGTEDYNKNSLDGKNI